MSSPLDLAEVARTREAAVLNGYSLLRVHGKRPVVRNWQDGERLDMLLRVTPDAANTGMNCDGFRAVDIDCDDPALVGQIVAAAIKHLPSGPLVRGRQGSPRKALIYRAADGEPGKLAIAGIKGKVEILG